MNQVCVGAAENTVEVPLFAELGGYGPFKGRRNIGVRDPLYCRVLTVFDGVRRNVLVITDMIMPVMDGKKLIQQLRANSTLSHIPIIAMTADAFSENITECLNAGMNGHIAKPIDLKLVIKEIRRIKEEETS